MMKNLGFLIIVMVFLTYTASMVFAQGETHDVCWEQRVAGSICVEGVTGMEFVWIPGGSFEMGCVSGSDECKSDESPVHTVKLDGFWMGKTEVTNAQYRNWKSEHDSKEYEGYSLNGDIQPAGYVSWEDANAFAEWLTEQHGGAYHFSLPSEAQWEYAARAGTRTIRFWGDDPDTACEYANVLDRRAEEEFDWPWEGHHCHDGYVVSAPVGQFRPNDFGLYDMLGNVSEWCADGYDRHAYRSESHHQPNPLVSSGGILRVGRGWSWRGIPTAVRSARREPNGTSDRIYDLGFRLVETP